MTNNSNLMYSTMRGKQDFQKYREINIRLFSIIIFKMSQDRDQYKKWINGPAPKERVKNNNFKINQIQRVT